MPGRSWYTHLPLSGVDTQGLCRDLLGRHALIVGGVEHEHLVQEGEGHDQEQGAWGEWEVGLVNV